MVHIDNTNSGDGTNILTHFFITKYEEHKSQGDEVEDKNKYYPSVYNNNTC